MNLWLVQSHTILFLWQKIVKFQYFTVLCVIENYRTSRLLGLFRPFQVLWDSGLLDSAIEKSVKNRFFLDYFHKVTDFRVCCLIEFLLISLQYLQLKNALEFTSKYFIIKITALIILRLFWYRHFKNRFF